MWSGRHTLTDNIDEVDYDREIKTVREAAEISEEELAELDFLEGIRDETKTEVGPTDLFGNSIPFHPPQKNIKYF